MKLSAVLILSIILVLSMACSIPSLTTASPTQNSPDYNATLMELSIQQTQTSMAIVPPTAQSTSTVPPTDTATSTVEITPTITNTPTTTTVPVPCNLAGDILDVTYPDGTKVSGGTSFVKTWRITNIGSCTWTSGYKLIFDSGDPMDSPAAVQLTPGTVAPGNAVDVSVQLTAPHAKGTYQGFYKLKAPDGTIFGIGPTASDPFWVMIKVPAPTAEPLADIKITDISTCSIPKMGVPCTIKVSVYNSSEVSVTTPFKVELFVGSAATAKCSWVIGSIVANGGFVKSCNYTFPSWYRSITLKAVADVDNVIPESNEANNQLSVNIIVVQ